MGLGVWLAWLFLISSGSVWLSDLGVGGYYLANLMLVMTISSAAVCLAAPYAKRFYEMLLMRRSLLMCFALLSAAGALGVIAAGPYYLGRHFTTVWLFWIGIVLIGIFSGIFSLKCGQLFGTMDPRQILFYSLLSEMMMVAVSYFVLGNNIFHSVPGGPPFSGILAFTLLPLVATYLVCLPAGDAPDTQGKRPDGKNGPPDTAALSKAKLKSSATGATGAPNCSATSMLLRPPVAPSGIEAGSRFSLNTLPLAFWQFLVVIFIFTVVSEMARCYFVFIRAPSLTYIDSIAVLLLRTLFAVLMLAFALRPHKQLRFSRVYLLSLVGVAVMMALIPFLQLYSMILGSLIGFASNVITFLVWCLLASVTFEKQASPIVVFGFGRSALLIGQACGWLLGIWVLPRLTGTNWELVCYGGMAVVTLVMVALFFSEQQFDRLFGEIAKAQVNLDFSLFSKSDQKKRRPWYEACRQAGKQAHLSLREQEIFELLVSGRSPENIATHLVLSLNTVRTHIRNTYAKFGVHNKTDLVLYVEAILKDENTSLPPDKSDV
jgi:DNA-binding CsgD family transcriptional regulator